MKNSLFFSWQSWLQEHPKLQVVGLFILGGLISFAFKGLISFAFKGVSTLLPDWLIALFILAAGLTMIAHRLRNPVPQGEPESRLFLALIAVVAGGIFLYQILFASE